MPLLVTVSEIREMMALGAGVPGGINAAIEQSIYSAQESVAASFRAPFARATVVDTFFVHHSLVFGSPPSYQSELLLSRGLVDTTQTWTVYASSTRTGLAAATTRVDLRSNSGTDHTSLEADTGTLRVTEIDLTNQFVQASYTAGLTDDDGDPAAYDNVPEWLRQAVRLKTLLLLETNPVIPRPTERSEEGARSRAGANLSSPLERQLANILLSHARYVPSAWKAQTSQVTLL